MNIPNIRLNPDTIAILSTRWLPFPVNPEFPKYNTSMDHKKHIVLALTGASGVLYGLEALQALKDLEHTVHLVCSPMAEKIFQAEIGPEAIKQLAQADFRHAHGNLNAPIASGSFHTDAMLVVPCSIKTLSGIANSYAENLIQRAADVTLKEGRPLLLAVREAPLHSGHLRLMQLAAEAGAIIFPPIPTFYHQPDSIEDLVRSTIGRMLARIGIKNNRYRPWSL